MNTTETPAAAPVADAPAAKGKPSKKAAPAKTFTLANRARELGVSPKAARASFRRLFKDPKPGIRLAGDGSAWEFPATEKAKVDARLRDLAE